MDCTKWLIFLCNKILPNIIKCIGDILKVVIAAGGTLGHINPALYISNKLVECGNEVYFITTSNNDISFGKVRVIKLDCMGFDRKNLFNNFNVIIKNNKSKKSILALFKKIKPDLVIGFGGSISTLVVKVALKNKKIKTAIHEQNAVFGLGNKLVRNKVDKVFLSFDNKLKGIVTGNPIISKYDKYSYVRDLRTVLITCGSNGATKVNDFFVRNISYFKNINKYKFILVTGDKYYNENKDLLCEIENDNFIILPKQKTLDELYKKANIVICRSGATTLAEVMGMRKLVITIPSPNVTNNHQFKNALEYQNNGCLEMITEEALIDPKELIHLIDMMIKNRYTYIKNIEDSQV